jgi:hypothetical protein
MPGRTRTWSQGDSWNKLAYAYTGDSRNFREILEYNESFDIRNKPAIGVPVFVTGPNGETGKNTSSTATGSPGTLNQLDTAINFSPDTANPEKVDIASAIFPWDTLDNFTERLHPCGDHGWICPKPPVAQTRKKELNSNGNYFAWRRPWRCSGYIHL